MTEAILLAQAVSPVEEIGSTNTQALEYLKLILILGFILLFAFIVLRVGLPWMTGARKLASGAIQVAARYPLEPKKNLYVIRVGPDYFLVGTTESGMHYLTALDSDHIEAALPQAETSPDEGEFAGLIKAFRRTKRSS